ncbi:MAG: glutamine synthetase III [Bacteroidetes bacterium]|nr:glutamine synthetase III [Bacteroidota bacterium]
MENIRFSALEISIQRKRKPVAFPEGKASEYFGELTFNSSAMKEYLTAESFRQVINSIEKGERIDRKTADQVAAGMKAWALAKGATNYTHWFFPLTGLTAEKHDSFLDPVEGGKAIENFSGNQLSQHEPDASSFPSGGMRSTFEARGYTAWDPTSPAFIIDNTLCIPTLFVSYTGEALDYKTPLLKSLAAIDKAAVDVCRYFDAGVTKVNATLGWEQEYFLVDSALYAARPDLVLTGRTLFGNAAAKDQQLEDHYLGAIPQRVIAFMQELEIEAHRLGIPVKTRHNEVAPNQYECAPVFEEANLSVDHNQLIMHLMENIAKRHDFTVLFHEKPYSGVNGSGKHNNWSLATNTKENLLSPGKTPEKNQRFLTFLVNIMKAVHDHADLIRSIIATPGNDHRLGANEAPPAIISVFLGSHLSAMIEMIEKSNKKIAPASQKGKANLFKNLPRIPEILVDETDRNRTSPFAFTGNKFEFRAVGSSQTCAPAMIVLNLILASQLQKFKEEVDEHIRNKVRKEDAIFNVLRKYIQESKNILFEGNNYSKEWVEEAAKRKLSNFTSTPKAVKAMVSRKTIKLFEENKILTGRELKARHEIHLEDYTKKLQIESRVLGDLATNHIIPGAIKYLNILCECVQRLSEVLDRRTFSKVSANQVETITEISEHIAKVKSMVSEMLEARKAANKIGNSEDKAFAYCEKVLPWFDKIRYHTNKLELLIDDEIWTLPKYRELLFVR